MRLLVAGFTISKFNVVWLLNGHISPLRNALCLVVVRDPDDPTGTPYVAFDVWLAPNKGVEPAAQRLRPAATSCATAVTGGTGRTMLRERAAAHAVPSP